MYEVSTIFKNDKFGELRTIKNENGETLFAAIDICKSLGYTNYTNALRDNVEDMDKFNIYKYTLFNNKTYPNLPTKFVNIYGLFSLVLGSKIPSAREFRHWVTHEVIPAVLTQGYYIAPQLTEKQKAQIALAQAIEECRDTVTIQEFAKFISSHNYNIGRNQLFEWLRTRGYLMSNPHHFNEPYQKYISAGYFKMTEKIVMQGNKPVIKRITLLTGKGQSYIGKKLINEHIRKMFKFKKLF